MSRDISLTMREALNDPETGEVFVLLLTMDHDDLLVPIRITSDSVNTVSNGETFVALPFEISLPSDSADAPPTMSLSVDNVDQEIVKSIRAISSPPTVLVELVRAADPSTVEATFPDFELREVSYDAFAVTGELTLEQFIEEPYPSATVTPADFPAAF